MKMYDFQNLHWHILVFPALTTSKSSPSSCFYSRCKVRVSRCPSNYVFPGFCRGNILFVTQGHDGIESGSFVRGIEAKEDAND